MDGAPPTAGPQPRDVWRRAVHSHIRMNHWGYVLAAYAVVALVLLGYWWRVERRIHALEERAGEPRR